MELIILEYFRWESFIKDNPLQFRPVKVTESASVPFTSSFPLFSVLIYVSCPMLKVTPLPTINSPLTSIYFSDVRKLTTTPSSTVSFLPSETTKDFSIVYGLQLFLRTKSAESITWGTSAQSSLWASLPTEENITKKSKSLITY